jgi:hypothetical protein
MDRIITYKTSPKSKMKDFKILLTDDVLVSNSGLVIASRILNDTIVFSRINRVSKIKKNIGVISDYDIIKVFIALIILGKPDYDSVEQYRNDKYFKKVLQLKHVPSSPTLRQRLETFSDEMWEELQWINAELLKQNYVEESRTINNLLYNVIDSDVTPMDNSKTKKEGVARTYKQVDGFAPMMSYVGKSGLMLNNELRNGDAHSNCEGTIKYFLRTIELMRHISETPMLMVLDSGNDDSKFLLMLKKEQVDFVIKRNLRRESREKYIEHAKTTAEGKDVVELYKGCTKYYSSWQRSIKEVNGEYIDIPLTVVVTEKLMDRQSQQLLIPEIEVEVYWNSLNVAAKEAEEIYHKHGTMEQYHSEFKSDLDLERLPSGKFNCNYTIMLLGMLSFNILRIIGNNLLKTNAVPGRRGKRLRLRTVILNVMYMAGQFIEHARQYFIKLFRGNLWTESFAMT